MIVHFLTLGVIALRFDFTIETYTKTQNTKDAYITSLKFVITTMTTVGYGDVYPAIWSNMIYTTFLEFGGIILYGFLFQKIMIFINETRNYQAMVAMREEDLDSWLLSRANKATSMKYSSVIQKIQFAFIFIWKWDFDNTFENDFYENLDPKIRGEVSEGPLKYILRYFSSFFKNFDYQDAMVLANLLKPRL